MDVVERIRAGSSHGDETANLHPPLLPSSSARASCRMFAKSYALFHSRRTGEVVGCRYDRACGEVPAKVNEAFGGVNGIVIDVH